MRLKKRRKSSRFAGSQTARRGHKARTRGTGNQGGKGWAGTGKRGDQKKTLVIKITGGNNYFGKSKTLRRGTVPVKPSAINLEQISKTISSLVAQGKAKESKGSYEIDLSNYKILGEGDITFKAQIKAKAASESAIEKVKKAGGEIILEEATAEDFKEDKKEEKVSNSETAKKPVKAPAKKK